MKYFLFILISIFGGGIKVEDAYHFFVQKNYKQSLFVYKAALSKDKYTESVQAIKFNIAQNYVEMDSIEMAITCYHQALEGKEHVIKAKSWNNIGRFLAASNPKEAMAAFKKALQDNPNDENARYNYELLLRLNPQIAQNDSTEEEQQNQNNNQQEEREEKNVDYYKKKFDYYGHQDIESQPTIRNYDSIPIERAMELLEEMKTHEIKFLQQLRKSAVEKNSQNKQKSEW